MKNFQLELFWKAKKVHFVLLIENFLENSGSLTSMFSQSFPLNIFLKIQSSVANVQSVLLLYIFSEIRSCLPNVQFEQLFIENFHEHQRFLSNVYSTSSLKIFQKI